MSARDDTLRALWARVPQGLPEATSAADLTIGVEQEFFLVRDDGAPVSHVESQAFLESIAGLSGWVGQRVEATPVGLMIDQVLRRAPSGRDTVLKFDHHPHLLEVAFDWAHTVGELEVHIREVCESLDAIAGELSLRCAWTAFASVPTSDPRLVSPLSTFEQLRHYRARLFELRGATPEAAACNYAAGIAATQVHVGGLPWWRRPELVEALYALEPEIAPFAALGPARVAGCSPGELLRRRWAGYARVFEGYPLVGFPDLARWTLEDWSSALSQSPLAAGPGNDWAGRNAAALGGPPHGDWDLFFDAVRDLQICRPRRFGTIEFRADAVQPTLESLLGLVALRLGLAAAVLANTPTVEFREAREAWWRGARGEPSPRRQQLLALSREGLLGRGLGEECHLEHWSDLA